MVYNDLTQCAVCDLLPHGPSFLFIDSIISYKPGRTLTAIKKIRGDEEYLKDHFPGNPVVPGVLIAESMAQAAGILAFPSDLSKAESRQQSGLYLLSRISDIRFKHPVRPGDTLTVAIEILRQFGDTVKVRGEATVGQEVVAEGELVLTKAKGGMA